jgi:hypothetical protein
MPKSLIALLVLTASFAAGLSALSAHGLGESASTAALWSLGFRLILVSWVWFDRLACRISTPFDFDAFVFFAWPVAVPYYFYRARGRRGLLIGAGLWLLYVLPAVTAKVVQLTVVN